MLKPPAMPDWVLDFIFRPKILIFYMKTITIEGHLRTDHGKKAARQIRSQESVPAVIYGGATEVNFYAPAKAFKSLVYTSEFMLAQVTVEGKTYKCILKDLQI